MQLYPAIDLLDGRVVRLRHGAFDAVTDYGDDPESIAARWRDEGADWLHVVDLSGARDGAQRQTATLKAIAAMGVRVQSGGGVRAAEDLERLYDAGVSRAVIGSLAVTDPARLIDWLGIFGPERIAAAFDVRIVDGVPRPATAGWTQTSASTLNDVLAAYRGSGLVHALATDIGRDGDLSGPSMALYRDLVAAWPGIAWQASGGVASTADLQALHTAGLSGAIIGKALFESRFSVGEAVSCLRGA